MSHNASVTVFIGVKIDPDLLYREEVQRACSHDIKNSKKFCPECGKAIFEKVLNPVDGFDEENDKVADFELIGEDRNFIIFNARETEYGEKEAFFGSDFDLIKIKEEMKEKLGPLGLFNEDTFGIYALLYESW